MPKEVVVLITPTGRQEPADELPMGFRGFISWRRLRDQLRRADEVKHDEEIVGFMANEDGITYQLEGKTP